MTPLLETRGLSKTFGGLKAVQNIDLRVGANRIVSVIGPNGAGKTTFFNCLSGIYRPDGGAILLDGRDITGRAPHQVCKLGVSRTFQNIRLFPEMSVLANVMVSRPCRCCFVRPLIARRKSGTGRRRWAFWTSSVWLIMPSPFRAAWPTVCSGAWKSPGRWRPGPGCFCSTSRRRG